MEVLVIEGAQGASESVRAVQAQEGDTLLDVLQRAGVTVQAACGGRGTCRKCAVDACASNGQWERVLACQTAAADGMKVRPPHEEGLRVDDEARVADGVLKRFPPDEVASAGDLGVAIDLGTTTIAAYLFDLAGGNVLARGGAANPQASFGADVISRIHACSNGSLGDMQDAAARCLRDLARDLCAQAGRDPAHIVRWAVAGNTVMEHILCGVSPESIGAYPFEPQSLFGETREVPGVAPAYACPCVSGYVGGDITAGIVACGLDELVDLDAAEAGEDASATTRRNVLFADLGTNGEMALVSNGRLLCCATATGPAFEGANISQGMQARDGAIDSCRFEEAADGAGSFAVTTVGGAPARGICGSGLIDALAACLKAGLVDETGRLLAPDELPDDRARLVELREERPVALLVPDGAVALTQKDVRALQLAKAAVAAGIASLLREAGLSVDQVDEFVIGGAFGAHMRPESAAAIGLFPKELLGRVRMVGNCAGAGACAALLSDRARERMGQVAGAAHYIELSLDAGFSEDYVDAMEFEEAIA